MVRDTFASDVAKAQDGSNKVIRVKGCMKGSSAEESGNVFAGDTVISVNGCSTQEMSIDQVRNMIVGPEGDIVSIGYFWANLLHLNFRTPVTFFSFGDLMLN